jgi:hypothetical protein
VERDGAGRVPARKLIGITLPKGGEGRARQGEETIRGKGGIILYLNCFLQHADSDLPGWRWFRGEGGCGGWRSKKKKGGGCVPSLPGRDRRA